MDVTDRLDERLGAFEHKLLAVLQPAICSLVQRALETNQSVYAAPLQAQREVLHALEAHQGRLEHTVNMLSDRLLFQSEDGASGALSARASHPSRDARQQHRSSIESVLCALGKNISETSPPTSPRLSGASPVSCDDVAEPSSPVDLEGPAHTPNGSNVVDYLRSGSNLIAPRPDPATLKQSLHSAEHFVSRRAHEHMLAQRKLSGRVLASQKFELVGGFVIALQVLCMGAMTGAKMSVGLDSEPVGGHQALDALSYLEFVFFVYYVLEILLKVHAFGPIKPFWTHPDRAWNGFDLILVVTAAFEIVSEATDGSGGVGNMSWLRLLRLLKMVKTLRVVRVMKFFRELRVIMNAIIGGLSAFFWVMTVCIIIMYIWALILMQGLSGYLDSFGSATDPPALKVEAIQHDWGDVQTSMLTLFKAVCGGGPWSPKYELLASTAGFPYDVLFLAYIAFMVLAVLKLLTGIFVNQARDVLTIDRSIVVQELQDHRTMLRNEFSDMFKNFDDDEDGHVTLEEFKEHLSNDTMKTYFASLDLDPTDPHRLWSIIDADKRGKLSQDEFVASLLVLRRQVRWMHVQHLEDLICDVYQLLETVAEQTEKVHRDPEVGNESPKRGEIPTATQSGEDRAGSSLILM